MKWLFTMAIACAGFCSDKVYITPDQVHIGREGILIRFFETLYPVTGLFQDAQGLHVMANELVNEHTHSYTCPLGHFSPNGTGMCNVPDCPFRKR